MEKRLVITNAKNKKCVALFEDDRLYEVDVIEDSEESLLGNIYVGRVENVVSNINAAFVEIKKGIKCFFAFADNENPIFLNHKNTKKVCIGDLLLVRVTRDAIKTKMPVCDSNILVSGKYVVANTSGEIAVSNKITDGKAREHLTRLLSDIQKSDRGFIARTNALYVPDEDILCEAVKLCELIDRIFAIAPHRVAFTCLYRESESGILKDYNVAELSKITTDDIDVYGQLLSHINTYNPSCVDKLSLYSDSLITLDKLYNVSGKIDDALKKRLWLKSGAFLVIEPTEALTVIDVNTGKYTSRKGDKEETFLKVNIEAAKTIAREIHLRNYSGIILIDFIDMSLKENNDILMDFLKTELAKDRVKTTLVDMTRLGLCEITRKRVKKPLHEVFKYEKNIDI